MLDWTEVPNILLSIFRNTKRTIFIAMKNKAQNTPKLFKAFITVCSCCLRLGESLENLKRTLGPLDPILLKKSL